MLGRVGHRFECPEHARGRLCAAKLHRVRQTHLSTRHMVNMAGVTLSALERVCVCLQTVTPVNDDAWTGLSQGALTAALAVQSARRRLRTQLSVLFLSPCPGVSLHMPHR